MNNDEKKIKNIVMVSLSALLFGTIFFMFGISIKSSILPFIVNYFISILLFVASFLAVHNNNKEKVKVLTYLEFLSLFFIIFITIVFIVQII